MASRGKKVVTAVPMLSAPAERMISGTPTATGQVGFTVVVTDSAGDSQISGLTVVVPPAGAPVPMFPSSDEDGDSPAIGAIFAFAAALAFAAYARTYPMQDNYRIA